MKPVCARERDEAKSAARGSVQAYELLRAFEGTAGGIAGEESCDRSLGNELLLFIVL